ncbi:MAG: fimbrillin family protein [Rikenellaceae bacterium]
MKRVTLALLAIAALAGCSKETGDTSGRIEGAATFTSSIVTRVTADEWESGDQVGIFVTDAEGDDLYNNTNSVDIYKYNALYNVDEATGDFSADTALDVHYYPVDGTALNFYAYYPYCSTLDVADNLYAVDITEQSTPKLIDLMEATTKEDLTTYTKDDYSVEFTFNRKMSKITFEIVAGTGMDLTQITSIELTGVYTTANYELANNTFSSFGGETTGFAPYTEVAANTYSAILIPTHSADGVDTIAGAYTSGEIIFHTTYGVESNDTFTWALDSETFNMGKNHIYTIKVNRTAAEFETNVINDWVDDEDTNVKDAE